jgi:methionine synthase II (cobalamin-independent)
MQTTTIAGSLPKPAWRAETGKLWPRWRLEGEALRRAQERAAAEWIAHQEAAGIDIVADGEQFRRHFVHGFLEALQGIDWSRQTPMGIRAAMGHVDPERLFPCANCGMAPIPYDVARGKLTSLAAGAALVRRNL